MDTNKDRLDKIARTYDSKVDFDFHLIRWNYREIKPRMRGPAVLELGCASGVMTDWLSADFPILHVVDGSAQYIAEVSSRVRPGVVFHHSLFEGFQSPRRFDDIVMARALEHLEEPVAVLRKIHDWLEAGGHLHIVVPNAQSLHRRIGVYMGMLDRPDALSERDHKYGHRRVYDADLLRQHLSEAGWQTEQIIGVFLKPLSNAQMLEFQPDLLEALFEMGRELPHYCAELYAVARRGADPR
jgi:2-polyprenyl-3-methyl-5-hydroxy-6-metoxy-1,4-benzoquinol methylase